MKKITKSMILSVISMVAVNTAMFAKETYSGSYEYSYSSEEESSSYVYNNEKVEILSNLDEIELPIRKVDYGLYYDDFDRLISKDLRKEAKELYEKQEEEKKAARKALEITKIEDAILPLHKSYKGFEQIEDFYAYQGSIDYSSVNEGDFALYDDYGRKISDEILEEADKIYKKQKLNQQNSYNLYGIQSFIYSFLNMLKVIIYIIVLCFAVSFCIKKIKHCNK